MNTINLMYIIEHWNQFHVKYICVLQYHGIVIMKYHVKLQLHCYLLLGDHFEWSATRLYMV